MKSLLLKDNSTVAKVCLFDKLAEGEYEEGSNLQITAVYAKKYLNFEQLTSTAQTKCQVNKKIKVVSTIRFYILYNTLCMKMYLDQ